MASGQMGIDLGTTSWCVGVYQHNEVKIVKTEDGNEAGSSCVAFTDRGLLIGDPAYDQLETNPTNTICNVKSLIGRRFLDLSVKKNVRYLPFKVVREKSRLIVQVKCKGKLKDFYPEEISAMLLMKIKETVDSVYDETINDAVIAVPSYFNNFQRQATKDAGMIAGLNVLGLINESTAAAVAYGMQKKFEGNDDRNIMIVDIGGGALDVAIVNIGDRKFDVKSTAGNVNLGGEDFVNKLFDHFANKFEFKFKKNLKTDQKAVQKLRNASERVKQTLSSTMEADIEINSLYDGHDFSTSISRAEFEEMCDELFKEILEKVQKSLKFAKLEKSEIDDIVLVGGSTRIPRIQKLLKDFFNGKSLDMSVNLIRAVAYGAAVQAGIFKQRSTDFVRNISIREVTSFSLGMGLPNRDFLPAIAKNTLIPAREVASMTTNYDGQNYMKFEIFEGEYSRANRNHLLGQVTITQISEAVKGLMMVDVSFDIDRDGILHVCASQKYAVWPRNPLVSFTSEHLSRAEVEKLRKEAEKYIEESTASDN